MQTPNISIIRHKKGYKLTSKQVFNCNINHLWNFISSPINLTLITPPELSLRITSANIKKPIVNSQIINYKVTPFSWLQAKWTTIIHNVEKDYRFTDKQVKGPFKIWEHTHTLEKIDNNSILMLDEVYFKLPYGWIGNLFGKNITFARLLDIFKYRSLQLEEIIHNKDYTQ